MWRGREGGSEEREEEGEEGRKGGRRGGEGGGEGGENGEGREEREGERGCALTFLNTCSNSERCCSDRLFRSNSSCAAPLAYW